MRISDWSSDVCSSDLQAPFQAPLPVLPASPGFPPAMLKFLLLSLIITGVWYGFRYVNRPRGGGQPPARPKTPPASPSQAQPQAPAQMRAEDMTACPVRSEEHTSELQSLMRISYAVFCLKKKTNNKHT